MAFGDSDVDSGSWALVSTGTDLSIRNSSSQTSMIPSVIKCPLKNLFDRVRSNLVESVSEIRLSPNFDSHVVCRVRHMNGLHRMASEMEQSGGSNILIGKRHLVAILDHELAFANHVHEFDASQDISD